MEFIDFRINDFIDILLVAFLMFQLYQLIKGTVAIHIFGGIFVLYIIWLVVRVLNMQLLSAILGQIMGVGVIALLIIFQQEIRRLALLIGTKYFTGFNLSLDGFVENFVGKDENVRVHAIIRACVNMAESGTGALIVIANKSELDSYSETGQLLDARTSIDLIETIFFKNSPLHDGAAIVIGDRIHAARCVLPVSENQNIPKELGLRHRSAVGITEVTDASVIVVSEETHHISYVKYGEIKRNISPISLRQILEEELLTKKDNKSGWKEKLTQLLKFKSS